MEYKPLAQGGLDEASGVTRYGDSLLIVSDADPGAYHRLPLADVSGHLVPTLPGSTTRCELRGQGLAVDPEAIDVLADGRIFVLSERLRSLVGEQGIIAQYNDPLSEVGERGLEGLAVRAGSEPGSSRVAVLWEGGYPEPGALLGQLECRIGNGPLRLVVLAHEVEKDQGSFKVKMDPGDGVELAVWSYPDSVDTSPIGRGESTMPKSRPPYPAEFRARMVELVRASTGGARATDA